MKTILIALIVAFVTMLVACDTDAEEAAPVNVDTLSTETTFTTELASISPMGEIPTPVASSVVATPIPTTVSVPVPTPRPFPIGDYYSPTLEEVAIWEALTADDRELGDKILSETDQYKMKYLISNRQVSITVKTTPFEEGKSAAEEWLTAQGLSPQSLCVISRINFHPSQEVMNAGYQYKAENTVPTSCDIPNS